MAALPPGIILVGHEVFASISQQEMLAAIPEQYRGLPHHHVSLIEVKADLSDLVNFDWITARNNQEAEVRAKLEPVLRDHPGWRIQYFGAAPIPLSMALGYQLSRWADVDTYQKLHERERSWAWPSTEASPDFLETPSLPQERLLNDADVIVRVSLSHVVYPEETIAVVPTPLGEIDVKARQPNEDLLRSPHDLAVAIARFGEVLDWAHEYRPNAQIHVFAAVTVGMAFRMGASINPTIHGDVQTYQYFGAQSPRYQRAFVLQRSARPEPALTEEDRAACRVLRRLAAEELERLKVWISTLPDGTDWIRTLFPEENDSWFSAGFRKLDAAKQTPLARSTVDTETTDVDDGFDYDPEENKWQFGDQLLNALRKRIPNEDDQRLALRLFMLHEGIHRGSQHLRQSRRVGRFPRVLEELDYQADVWAYLHEAARLRSAPTTGALPSMRAALISIIKRAIDTFWAFASTTDPSRMEVRRVNRYLIWYWKKLEIEKLTDESATTEFLKTLADKPIVEIAGATVKLIEDRAWFHLDQVNDAEIAVLWQSRLNRAGHGLGTPVGDIFKGFRERDDQVITQALRSIADMFTDA